VNTDLDEIILEKQPLIEKTKLRALIDINLKKTIKPNQSNGGSNCNIESVASSRNTNFQIPNAKALRTNLEKKRRKCLERDKKVSRSLALLVFAFAICW
jgi:hypothetical protein